MKPNFVGIAGGIIALISLVMPWWTLTDTSTLFGTPVSASINMYPYRVSVTYGFDIEMGERLWFGWMALALIVAGGILGIVGGITGKPSILLAGGVSSMSSIAVFVAGLVKELPSMTFFGETDVPKQLFYFGTVRGTHHLSMYLSVGVWLALISGIMMLISFFLKPQRLKYTPVPPPPANRYCTFCGAELSQQDVFCRKCGKVVPSE